MTQGKFSFNMERWLETISETEEKEDVCESPIDNDYDSETTLYMVSDADSNSDDWTASSDTIKTLVASGYASTTALNKARICISQLDKLELPKISVCAACLGTLNSKGNPLIECIKCAATVHKYCYDWTNECSILEPWLCDPCAAGVESPSCELCPNTYGIFKAILDNEPEVTLDDEDTSDIDEECKEDILEAVLVSRAEMQENTERVKYAHVVCALYVPGRKCWTRDCTLCTDAECSGTGSRINCDANLCRTSFHVTCAQAAGLLVEETGASAVPYYAFCTHHSQKVIIEARKRNYLVSIYNMRQRANEKSTIVKPDVDTPLACIGVECIAYIAECKNRLIALRHEVNTTQIVNVFLLVKIAELSENCQNNLLELSVQKAENEESIKVMKLILENSDLIANERKFWNIGYKITKIAQCKSENLIKEECATITEIGEGYVELGDRHE